MWKLRLIRRQFTRWTSHSCCHVHTLSFASSLYGMPNLPNRLLQFGLLSSNAHLHNSKWISNGNIQRKVVLSPRRIAEIDLRDDPTFALGQIWDAQWEGEVKPKNEKGEIKPQAETCSNRYLIEECFAGERTTGAAWIFPQQPDIAGIHE